MQLSVEFFFHGNFFFLVVMKNPYIISRVVHFKFLYIHPWIVMRDTKYMLGVVVPARGRGPELLSQPCVLLLSLSAGLMLILTYILKLQRIV